MAATSNPRGAGQSGPHRRTSRPRQPLDLNAIAQVSGKVTAMEPQQRDHKRRSLYVDGEFVAGLHEETIILAKLKVGQQVEGKALVEAIKQDEAKRAWDAALHYLAATARSEREVQRRLSRTYPPEVVEGVIGRLQRGGWLDDAEFARVYVRSHSSYGEQRLLRDLARRGVNRAVASEVVGELLEGSDPVSQARTLAESRLARMGSVDRETAQRRLAGFLARRGYGFDAISAALGPLLSHLPRAPRPARGFGRRIATDIDED